MNFFSHNLPLSFDNALTLEGVIHNLKTEIENITKKYENIELDNKNYIDEKDKKVIEQLTTEINTHIQNLTKYTNDLVATTKENIETNYDKKINDCNTTINEVRENLTELINNEIEQVKELFKTADELLKSQIDSDFMELKSDVIKRLNDFQEMIIQSNFTLYSPYDGNLKSLTKSINDYVQFSRSFFCWNVSQFVNLCKNNTITVGVFNTNKDTTKKSTVECLNNANAFWLWNKKNNIRFTSLSNSAFKGAFFEKYLLDYLDKYYGGQITDLEVEISSLKNAKTNVFIMDVTKALNPNTNYNITFNKKIQGTLNIKTDSNNKSLNLNSNKVYRLHLYCNYVSNDVYQPIQLVCQTYDNVNYYKQYFVNLETRDVTNRGNLVFEALIDLHEYTNPFLYELYFFVSGQGITSFSNCYLVIDEL